MNTGSNALRQEAVKQLYLKSENYNHILDMALSDRRLLPVDGERITEGVAAHLHLYDGPLADEPFQEWASEIIQPAVSRMGEFYDLKTQHEKVVYSAIWKIVKNSLDLRDHYDPAKTVRQIADDVWLWVFLNLELLRTGTARVGTRLYAKARWEARRWKKSRVRDRERFLFLGKDRDLGVDEHGRVYVVQKEETEEIA
jgi:hypothetical protein